MNEKRAFTPEQQRLIDRHRDINVDHDWWDYLYEQFVDQLKLFGIHVAYKTETYTGRDGLRKTVDRPRIHFELYTQGSGAQFACRAFSVPDLINKGREAYALAKDHDLHWMLDSEEKIPKLLRENFERLEATYGTHMLHHEHFDILDGVNYTSSVSNSRYCHSGDMDIEAEASHGVDPDEEADEHAAKLIRRLEDDELQEMTVFLRGLADALYRDLEQEYSYLTSDEAVWDAIEANGLDEEVEEDEEDEEDEEEEDASC